MAGNLTLLSKTVSIGVDNILVGPWYISRISGGEKGEGKERWERPRKENILHGKDSVSKLDR